MKTKRGRPSKMRDAKLVSIRLPESMIEQLKKESNYSELIRTLLEKHFGKLDTLIK